MKDTYDKNILLWCAGLSLEVLYSIVNVPSILSHLNCVYDEDRPNSTAIASMSEILVDYSVIATSSRSNILGFVACAKAMSNSNNDYSPRFFVDAKEFTKVRFVKIFACNNI